MTDLSGLDTDSLLQAAGLTPNAHPVPQPPPGPDLSGMSNADLMKAAGPVSVPIPPPDTGTGTNSPLPSGGNNVPTAFPGFQTGLADLYSGGVQFMLHALEATAPAGSDVEKLASKLRDAMDKKISDDEATYQKSNASLKQNTADASQLSTLTGTNVVPLDPGRLLGNVVGAAPLTAAAPETLPARVAAGAVTGTLASVAQPSTAQGADYWLEKAKEASLGAGVGGLTAPIGGAAARIVKPNTSSEVSTLIDSGVKPTLGQLLGKTSSRLEEGLTSMPLVGDVIKAGQKGAVEDFNRATINQALAPIGEKLDPGTQIGRKSIDEMSTKIGAAYDRLVPSLTAQVDPQFAQGMQNLATLASNLPPEQAAQFKKLLTNEVLNKFSSNGTMSGQAFKDVESNLGRIATDYSSSALVNERYFGNAVRQAQDEMRQLLTRSNPDAAADLQANNTAYAMLKRIQGASVSSVKNDGVFTPAQLLQAIRSQDPSLGKGSFARGNALMQVYGEAGEGVLGSKLPDSGTAFRNMVDHPIYSAAMSPAALAALAPYSETGRKLAKLLIAMRPPGAGTVAAGIRQYAPVLGGALTGQDEAGR